jgi:hypothetical protein
VGQGDVLHGEFALEGGVCLERGGEWADGFKDIHNRVFDRDMVCGQPVRV